MYAAGDKVTQKRYGYEAIVVRVRGLNVLIDRPGMHSTYWVRAGGLRMGWEK